MKRRGHLYLSAALAAVTLVLVVRSCTTSPAGTAAVDHAAASTAAESSAPADSTVAGWGHERHGARSAAVAAVRLTGALAQAGFITRADMIDKLASARYAPILTDESAGQIDELVAELTPTGVPIADVSLTELPLTARVATYQASRARVEVWSVMVITVGDVAAPRQVWRTVTITVVWQDDAWRVDDWSAVPGPTPALATNAAVASTDEIAVVTSWPPVGAP